MAKIKTTSGYVSATTGRGKKTVKVEVTLAPQP
jgi:hypothetical protein